MDDQLVSLDGDELRELEPGKWWHFDLTPPPQAAKIELLLRDGYGRCPAGPFEFRDGIWKYADGRLGSFCTCVRPMGWRPWITP